METPIVTVLENCRISPPPETIADESLPLTFFDLLWIPFEPLSRVIIFDIPGSTNHFTNHIVPNLKTSLSLALKHFYPLAGNLIKPSDDNLNTDLQIRYLQGDSVSITFAECSGDFNHFSGNHVRDAETLKLLVPQLPPANTCVQVSGEDCSVASVFAIQVTVFPNKGISFGFTNSHMVADGSSVYNFVQAWAFITKQVDVGDLSASGGSKFQIPYYDRSSVKDPRGIGNILRSALGVAALPEHLQKNAQNQPAASVKSRGTFVLKEAQIQALKNLVLAKRPTLPYLSSFTAVCAYIWTCMAKTRAAAAAAEDDEPLNFGFAVDCRARLDPPLPSSYFGNCLTLCVAWEKRKELAGEEGLFIAAELLGKALFEKINNQEGGVLKGVDKVHENEVAGVLRGEWYLGVAGSPKLDYYNTVDFGFGKPKKFEFVSEPFSISRCKDSKLDLELGLILPNNEMHIFSDVFTQGLPDSAV